MTTEFITVTDKDFNRISDLIEQRHVNPYLTKDITMLSEELDRARILDFPEIPSDLVTMNSKFRYADLTEGKEATVTLVYPGVADPSKGKISVTAPLGTALLGLREGEEIEWIFPDGKTKKLRLLEILYQPEANGQLHL